MKGENTCMFIKVLEKAYLLQKKLYLPEERREEKEQVANTLSFSLLLKDKLQEVTVVL